jgi:hypothetical protein
MDFAHRWFVRSAEKAQIEGLYRSPLSTSSPDSTHLWLCDLSSLVFLFPPGCRRRRPARENSAPAYVPSRSVSSHHITSHFMPYSRRAHDTRQSARRSRIGDGVDPVAVPRRPGVVGFFLSRMLTSLPTAWDIGHRVLSLCLLGRHGRPLTQRAACAPRQPWLACR